MNLSLSVVLTILFLAPGFAGYFGLSVAARGRSVRRPAPPPNSLLFLVGVALCATAAHCAALLVFAAQDLWCRGHACFPVGFDPDAYANLTRLIAIRPAVIRSAAVLYELAALATLCLVVFVIVEQWARRDLRSQERSLVAPLLYGWLAPYVQEVRGGAGAVSAYVLTRLRHGDFAFGYRGIVVEVRLDPTGEISSVTLAFVYRFAVPLGGETAGQRTVLRGGPLGTVHIPGREIENIVLTIVPFAGADGKDAGDPG